MGHAPSSGRRPTRDLLLMPLYLVWIQREESLEAPAVYASTHPVAVGDVIVVERETCQVDRVEAAPDTRYDAIIHARRS